MKNITVIDYGMSNLHSVIKSFQKVSNKKYKVCVATTNEDLEKASMIVLPGQGAAKSCMQKITNNFPRLHEHILNKPFFGICLGLQIAIIEMTRSLLKLKDANSTEFKKRVKNNVISLVNFFCQIVAVVAPSRATIEAITPKIGIVLPIS